MDAIYFEFQPIIDRNEKIYGYEALMRFKNNTTISAFIQSLSSYNDFYDLEEKTFFKALNDFKGQGKLFINSFPHIMFEEEKFNDLINKYGNKLINVVVEILEAPQAQIKDICSKIYHFKKYGCFIALDDYGTGNYTEEINFKEVSPNIVKIDRSLIYNIFNNRLKQEKVIDIIKKCKENGILVLAEGVELPGDYMFLKNLDIDFFQGYYITDMIEGGNFNV